MKEWMSRLGAYARQEKTISVMLVFLIALVLSSVLIHHKAAPVLDDGGKGSEIALGARQETASDLKRVGVKMAEELRRNSPRLIKPMAVFFIFLAAGLLIDLVCIAAWRGGNARFSTMLSFVPWAVGDVFKGFVVLFFLEALMSLALLSGSAAGMDFGLGDGVAILSMTLVRSVAVGAYIFILVKRRYGSTAADLGLRFGRLTRNILTGLAAYAGFLPVYLVLLLMVTWIVKLTGWEPPVQHVVDIVYREKSAGKLLAFGVFIAFIGPVFEELFFRGFIYQAFRKKWGIVGGMVVVSIAFALLHAHWAALLPIFALSVVLCWTFEITGSLVPGMVLHMTHNMAMLAIMFLIKGFE